VNRAPRLVGRDDELGALNAARQRAAKGQGGTVFVEGPAGIGKSALVRIAFEDSSPVSGRASPPPSPTAQPLAEVALALVRAGADPFAEACRVHRGALRVLLPGSGLAAGETEAPMPMHVGDALLVLSDQVARHSQFVVLEDLHWADQFTLQAVEYLADRVRGSHTLLVATTRPTDATHALAARLRARQACEVIALGHLTAADVSEVVAACLGGSAPEALLPIVAVADGVPLQIEELLVACERAGTLVCDANGSWSVDATAPVPDTVSAGVAARLASLRANARAVIDAAALVGRVVVPELLVHALEESASAVDAALDDALAVGLLAARPGTGDLWFSHDLVRDAVASQIGRARRVELARRLSGALGERGGLDSSDRAAELAALAGDDELAAQSFVRGAGFCLDRGLPSEAVTRLDLALEHTTHAKAALPIREQLLRALALAGDVRRARAEVETVHRQLVAIDAGVDRTDACAVSFARAAANAGAWAEASEKLRGLSGASPEAWVVGSVVALELGHFDEALRLARAVVEADRASAAQRCEAFEVLGRLDRRHDLDAAAAWFRQAIATAELADLDLWAARASHELATIEQLHSLTVDGLIAARERAVNAGAPALTASIDFHLAAVHGVRFESEPALEAARRFLDVSHRLGATRQEAWAWNLIGQAHAVAGARERAAAAAEEALVLAGDDHEIAGVAIGMARAVGSLLEDDRARGLDELRAGIERLRQLPGRIPLPPWYLWPLLATMHDLEGDGGARAREETADPALHVAHGFDGLWHLAHAVAHGRAGDVAGANESSRRAQVAFAAVPGFAGYMHLGRRFAAEAALSDGWGEPDVWLTDAQAWASARGLRTLASTCGSLARRAGVRQTRRRRGAAEVPPALAAVGVTSREVDVLRLVAEGLTNAEIAERLYLSPKTVKGYVENLLAKTNSANRTQLAALLNPPTGGSLA
jgi:DNA-binding CsgD family transcriptional regulator/tetratricopeptide (TPR) repeat protein